MSQEAVRFGVLGHRSHHAQCHVEDKRNFQVEPVSMAKLVKVVVQECTTEQRCVIEENALVSVLLVTVTFRKQSQLHYHKNNFLFDITIIVICKQLFVTNQPTYPIVSGFQRGPVYVKVSNSC